MFTGIGTVVNTLAILIGGIIGLLLKKGISKRLQDIIMQALGLVVIFIGAAGALSGLLTVVDGVLETNGIILLLLSLVIGAIIGELINIEGHLDSFGKHLKQKFSKNDDGNFVEGFVSSSLVVCVGAMGVLGCFQDALLHDPSTLFVKALIDGIIILIFASAMGIGAVFSALPLLIYQGILTILAQLLSPLISDQLITQLSYVGSVLIFAIGINLLFGKKIRVGNMIPALLIPIVWTLIKCFF